MGSSFEGESICPLSSFIGLSFVAIFCCLSSLFDMLWGFAVFTHLWRFCSFGVSLKSLICVVWDCWGHSVLLFLVENEITFFYFCLLVIFFSFSLYKNSFFILFYVFIYFYYVVFVSGLPDVAILNSFKRILYFVYLTNLI